MPQLVLVRVSSLLTWRPIARRWQAAFGEADMAELVESIPLAETREYVKRVLTNSAHYRLLLGR